MRAHRSAKSAIASAWQTRYCKRADEPAGLWPWGWLPLLGLFATFVYGLFFTAPQIQAHTLAGVARQLEANDVDVLGLEVHGQRVVVRTATTANKQRVRDTIGAATCSTWLGDVACPTRIDIEVAVQPGGSMGIAGAKNAQSTGAAAVANAKPHRFNLKRKGNVVVLRGEVPTEEVRRVLVTEADTMFSKVSDYLTVTNDPSNESFDWARQRVLRVLGALDSGQVIWESGRLSVRGIATEDNQVIINAAIRSGSGASPGQIHLEGVMTAENCNAQFEALLDANALLFGRGSPTLLPESAPVLERVAALTQECPQPLLIAGHTDGRGRAQMNRDLSLARAESVKAELIARGVAAERMTTQGYGADQPIADNATEAGRAANRRIELLTMEAE